jgi:hypothetical protein
MQWEIRAKQPNYFKGSGRADTALKSLPKDISPADFEKYVDEADAWLNDANGWILKNLGAAASARFLDLGGGLSLIWDRAANPRHNSMINALIKHRDNLAKMIEVNAWDAGADQSKAGK